MKPQKYNFEWDIIRTKHSPADVAFETRGIVIVDLEVELPVGTGDAIIIIEHFRLGGQETSIYTEGREW